MFPHRRQVVSLALALVAAAIVAEPLVTIAGGSGSPGWAHWLCSPAALHSAAHAVRGSGIGATLLTALKVHWPHFLPILPGLATLVYLQRANARYHSEHGQDDEDGGGAGEEPETSVSSPSGDRIRRRFSSASRSSGSVEGAPIITS
jgi:hypothetical protein